ncbi:pantoate--beta-alanine ligase [Solitalea lacus]|uniref:pantoate--beta-alanine ligase n=1 Tax=Solitalea lacus TaxID=2911172 RepID=UPI001EDBD47E|nr:pantoate--beta-alanine ligase [Solitalea lacus]UKJ07565.1 pantoate--beta-alanine ligase [Solitalea lacus]
MNYILWFGKSVRFLQNLRVLNSFSLLKIITTKAQMQQELAMQQGKSIGFVPTMGALHNGHLSLIEQSKQENDFTVCSIFVNPTQFNDPADLERYPRPVDADLKKLQDANCDLLFMPAVDEMYAKGETWHMDLGDLEHVLEGAFRPGHYQGVTQVVKKLFDIVQPTRAYFGQKDYQQVMVIKKMVETLNLPVSIVRCSTVREQDGLAMSSRNVHLSNEEHQLALTLSSALNAIKESVGVESVAIAIEHAKALILSKDISLEYLVVVDGATLKDISDWNQSKELVALVAAKVGKTRLIDNVVLS